MQISDLLVNVTRLPITKLALDRNRITVIPRNAFVMAPLLSEINLNYNNLTMIHPDTINPIRNSLLNVSFVGNNFEILPFLNHKTIKHVDLRENCLSSVSKFFESDNVLETLKLGAQSEDCNVLLTFNGNRLSELRRIKEIDFRGSPGVPQSLVFANGFFDDVPASTKIMRLQDAVVTSIKFRMSRLQSLHVENIASEILVEDISQLCERMTTFYLKDVRFITTSSSMNMKSFTKNCPLKQLYIENATNIFQTFWGKLPNLTRLTLRKHIPTSILSSSDERVRYSDAVSLTHLDLSENEINQIEDNFFGTMRSLTYLSLSNNELTKFGPEPFKNGTSTLPLQTLDMSKNQISELDNEPLGLPALRFLNLSSNMIRNVSENFFSESPNLTLVDLTHNQLRSLEDFAALDGV